MNLFQEHQSKKAPAWPALLHWHIIFNANPCVENVWNFPEIHHSVPGDDPVSHEVWIVVQQHVVPGIHSIPGWLFHINLSACPFRCPIM